MHSGATWWLCERIMFKKVKKPAGFAVLDERRLVKKRILGGATVDIRLLRLADALGRHLVACQHTTFEKVKKMLQILQQRAVLS